MTQFPTTTGAIGRQRIAGELDIAMFLKFAVRKLSSFLGRAFFSVFICGLTLTAMVLPLCSAGAQSIVAERTIFAAPVVTIYPGEIIGDDMVAEREFGPLRPVRGGYVASVDALIGKIARRTLMPGFAIPQNAVENAKLVQKGVPTQLVFEDGALTITTLVSPLQAGELNKSIRARNLDSGLIVYGVVQRNGTLRAAGG